MELSANSATQSFVAFGRRVGGRLRISLNALADDLAGLSSHSRDWQAMIFAGANVEVYRRGKSAPERVATFGADFDRQALNGLQRCLSTMPHKRIALRLSPDRAVTRLIALPVSAQDVVAAIVRNKVESLAPWPLSEALWGFRRSSEPSQAGQLNVEVGIIGRRSIEGLLLWLGKTGAEVRQLDIADSAETDDSIEIDFLRENKTERIRKRFTSAMTWLGLGAAACAGFGTYLLVSSINELQSIDARTSELTSTLRDQSSDSTEGSKLSEARKLIERKRTEQPTVQIIESLTRSIPNQAWLETLDYEDHLLTIVGRGTSIPPIVDALEKSGVFSDVNFASPTQHDAVAKVDSFSISASVQPLSVAQ
jgi:general secretion pathway protein L